MVPHTTPAHWDGVRPGRFAATILRNEQVAWAHDAEPGNTDLGGCRVALIGLADDTGVLLNRGRVGARGGPSAFRAALSTYGVANPSLPRVFDAGDIIVGSDIHQTHDRITTAVNTLLELGLFPVGIGGGHDLTFPFVRAVAQRLASPPGSRVEIGGVSESSRLSGVYLDAHLDVRQEVGSGMPFRRLVEDCGVASLTCIGADEFANASEHVDWFRAHSGSILTSDDAERDVVSSRVPRCFASESPLFVSIDMDCLNVAHAPGVSAINPSGLSPRTVASYAYHAGRSSHVHCFDIMELNPTYDIDQRTARLAAHLFLQFLRGFSERPA